MTAAATTEAGARPMRAGRPRLPARPGTLPFFGYVGVFLLLPTGILVVDAFKNPSGSWNFGSLSTLYSPAVWDYFIGSFKLCVLSAVAGAVFGALVAYAVASGKPDARRRLRWPVGCAGPVRRGDPGLRVPGAHRTGRAVFTRAGITASRGVSP